MALNETVTGPGGGGGYAMEALMESPMESP